MLTVEVLHLWNWMLSKEAPRVAKAPQEEKGNPRSRTSRTRQGRDLPPLRQEMEDLVSRLARIRPPILARAKVSRRAKGKGQKGKAHALEGESGEHQAGEQEWPDEEPEKEGNLGLLCVAGGSSAASARAQPSPMDRETPKTIIRPEHGELSWFWSRPKN